MARTKDIKQRHPSRAKSLDLDAPWEWLSAGWQDLKKAPKASISYGLLFVAISYLMFWLIFLSEQYFLILPLVAVFMLLGPVAAIGLYDISIRLEQGRPPTLRHAMTAWRRNGVHVIAFCLILLIIALAWMRAAGLTFSLYFNFGTPSFDRFIEQIITNPNMWPFIIIGCGIGAFFAILVFCISAFSIPMLIARDVDVMSAVITSLNAVGKNKKVMLLWATLILMCIGIGMLTFMIGLCVMLPLIGHATWHAYENVIEKVPIGTGANVLALD